jgi:hypothetical protein
MTPAAPPVLMPVSWRSHGSLMIDSLSMESLWPPARHGVIARSAAWRPGRWSSPNVTINLSRACPHGRDRRFVVRHSRPRPNLAARPDPRMRPERGGTSAIDRRRRDLQEERITGGLEHRGAGRAGRCCGCCRCDGCAGACGARRTTGGSWIDRTHGSPGFAGRSGSWTRAWPHHGPGPQRMRAVLWFRRRARHLHSWHDRRDGAVRPALRARRESRAVVPRHRELAGRAGGGRRRGS